MTDLEPGPAAPAPTPPPAGWYADPQNPYQERWWNGVDWGVVRPRQGVYAPPPPFASTPRLNRSAWWSLGLGILGLVLGLVAVTSGTHSFWISSAGVVAVFSGIRALRLQRAGLATAVGPAIAGIVLGSLGVLLTLAVLVLNLTFFTSSSSADSVDGAAQQVAPQSVGGAPSAGATDVQPPSTLPDDALARYTALPVRSVTSVAAGCGVVRGQLDALPQGETGSAARRMQDFLNLQVQGMAEALQNEVKGGKTWPTAIDVDPDTHTVFVPAPSCAPLGAVPPTVEVRYGRSPDRAQVALALYHPGDRVGALWRSVDDTVYLL